MNIAFSFALVFSHVLDLSLCLSCLVAQRASENKARTAGFFFSLIPMDVFVCCTATSKTPGKHQKGLSIRGVNKTLTLLEMKWREKKKKKNVRGEFKNRMKIYRSVFFCVFGQHIICKAGSLPPSSQGGDPRHPPSPSRSPCPDS